MKVEVCANSVQSAINAQKAGADSIELCVELAVGGITPSYGLLKKVMEVIDSPVRVLIRLRSGHFRYSNNEFESMKEDILLCKKLGCAGIVSGVLNEDNSIDIKRTKELVELSKPLSFTFHRAFDWIPNPIEALEELQTIGVTKILTSGQENSAEKGLPLLTQLLKKVRGKLTILPGGGISIPNVLQFKEVGFEEVHCSATTLHTQITPPKVAMNSSRFFDETQLAVSDLEKIKMIVHLVK